MHHIASHHLSCILDLYLTFTHGKMRIFMRWGGKSILSSVTWKKTSTNCWGREVNIVDTRKVPICGLEVCTHWDVRVPKKGVKCVHIDRLSGIDMQEGDSTMTSHHAAYPILLFKWCNAFIWTCQGYGEGNPHISIPKSTCKLTRGKRCFDHFFLPHSRVWYHQLHCHALYTMWRALGWLKSWWINMVLFPSCMSIPLTS